MTGTAITVDGRIFRGLPEGPADVIFVLMPYGSPGHPSLALGLLKSALTSAGLTADVIYANLLFARMIGYDRYQLATHSGNRNRVGDWTFAGTAFPDYRPPLNGYLSRAARVALKTVRTAEREEIISGVFREIRDAADRFTDRLARIIIEKKPKIVGCSSTFEQHVASLALLRRIKELSPQTATIIGGANCEGVMGATTVREFPWIDIAFSGEADEAIVPLCRLLIERGRGILTADLPIGAINRELAGRLKSEGEAAFPTATVPDLDRVPIPNYDEYFKLVRGDKNRHRFTIGLMMETSRGCWWRSKEKGCTFCGLNRSTTTFRAKSPERAFREMGELSRGYGLNKIEMTDNIIPPAYFSSLFPRLAAEGGRYSLFYEFRPGRPREQIRRMAEAGITFVQAGLEGLHDGMLALMGKGTTGAGNLASLKYMREYGIRPIWGFLTGFPGEDDEWHFQVAEWLPLVHHLPAPRVCQNIFYQRFSIYHSRPERYGLSLKPNPAYRFSYPLTDEAISGLAYFFENESPPEITPGIMALRDAMMKWMGAYYSESPPLLCMTDRGDCIEIMDTRRSPIAELSRLTGCAARVYRACDKPLTRREAVEAINRDGGDTLGDDAIEAAVDDLKRRRLLIELHGKLFSLALAGEVPETRPMNRLPGGFSPMANLYRVLASAENAAEKKVIAGSAGG